MPSRMKGYLKYRRHVLLLYLALCGVFATVQAVSGQRMDLVAYTLLLLTAAFLAFLAADYRRTQRRYQALHAIQEALSTFEQDIPPGEGPIEQAYCAIAGGLRAIEQEARRAQEDAHRQTLTYYTMWMHQVKTPLFALRLLLEEPQADRGEVERALFEMERYVDMALTYVKAGALADDAVLSACEADEVIRASVKKYARLFIAKKLYARVEPTGILAATDSKWLAFILEQGLSNAVKYTRAGGVRIYGEGNTIVMEDTGMGIRPEDAARVFERGFTGYNGRVETRASGLGLYLARRVADQIGVRLAIEGTQGGTRFCITLPRHEPWIFGE